jgi:hypothetical protein
MRTECDKHRYQQRQHRQPGRKRQSMAWRSDRAHNIGDPAGNNTRTLIFQWPTASAIAAQSFSRCLREGIHTPINRLQEWEDGDFDNNIDWEKRIDGVSVHPKPLTCLFEVCIECCFAAPDKKQAKQPYSASLQRERVEVTTREMCETVDGSYGPSSMAYGRKMYDNLRIP